jgi:23S rRNA (adenine2503-C2)-methyltransferase
MEILERYGKEDLAILYLARMRDDDRYLAEFVEAVQPPIPREEKWVLMISSGFGCPVRCAICDAGNHFHGWLTPEEILSQVDFLVDQRCEDRVVPIRKFKIQFARMGEPSMNPSVLDVLKQLPKRYEAPGLMPCISSIAPEGREDFFEELIDVKTRYYRPGSFRLQFSIHSTDPEERAYLVPRKTWSLEEIAEYGKRFVWRGDAKICLNFAPARDASISAQVISDIFDPRLFLIKLTPINPTDRALERRSVPLINRQQHDPMEIDLVQSIEEKGFEVIVSIGELEENAIGTNCGQMATRFVNGKPELTGSYPNRQYRLS